VKRFIICLGLILCATGVYASSNTTLSQVTDVLTGGGRVLTKLMWAACVVVGIGLIAAAFTQFQIHRRNPKLVPLTTPVMYLILGIFAIAVPFLNTWAGFMGERKDVVKAAPANTRRVYDPNDIDAPL
jgi:type II secretory pathway component PulF